MIQKRLIIKFQSEIDLIPVYKKDNQTLFKGKQFWNYEIRILFLKFQFNMFIY